MANGIDVYTKYQTVTSWPAVRGAGYEFAYVKVSDGTSTKDTAGWGPKGRSAGVKMGAYHYAQPGDAVAQANLLVDRAASEGLTDLAPALDLEAPFVPGQAAINFAIAFLKQVRSRGHRPCLYANNSMLTSVRAAVLAAVPETLIWVARYGASPTVGYDFWQHSSSGQVPGVTASSVDLNTGAVPLDSAPAGGGASAPSPVSTSARNEERTVEAPASADNYKVIPTFGGTKLYVGAAYGRTVNCTEIWHIGASGSTGGAYLNNGAGQSFAADRPGPLPLSAGTVSVTIRYNADHEFVAWVA